MNARAHIAVLTLTVANMSTNGDILFPKSAVAILPGGRRVSARQHVNRGVVYTTDSIALPPRFKEKVRFDIVDETVDFTEIDELTIEWPPMLVDATKGAERRTDHVGGGSNSSTQYSGKQFQLPPTVIRREKN